MKVKLLFVSLFLICTQLVSATVKVDISSKLMYVTEDLVIDGLDENTEEGVIFVTLSMYIDKGARIKVRNACLIIEGSLSGNGIIDVEDSATVTLLGDKEGRITFTNKFLADASCQQSLGGKYLRNIKEVPDGLNYSLYNTSGRLLDKGQIDGFIKTYRDIKKMYYIKVEGYKLRKILFKG